MNIKNILADNEKVEYSTKSSMAPFLVPVGVAVVLAVVGLIMILVNSVNSFVFGIVALIVAGLALIYSLTKLEFALTTKLYVTDKRVILNSGLFKSVLSELPIDKVSGVTVIEPLLGKLFHYGTVVVESSASSVGVRAQYIVQPYEFKKMLKIEQR